MASAVLSKELECPICTEILTDPVNLRCGHNFCRVCIDRVLDSQEGNGRFSCPQCRDECMERPALLKNIALRNIAEHFLSTREKKVFCTYCVDSPVPAVVCCLHCEVFLCERHQSVHHTKAPEHDVCAPTTSLENRRCPIHREPLRYYCTDDDACACVTCTVIGGHVRHKMVSLDEGCETKKRNQRNIQRKLKAETEKAEKRIQSLEELRRKAQEKADSEAERVTALFRDLRRRLEDLERRVLSDIMRQVKTYNDVIGQLEVKKKEMYKQIRRIEELCNMTDPLTVLQESGAGDLYGIEVGDIEDREKRGNQLVDGRNLDMAGISHTFHLLSNVLSGITGGDYIPLTDILLDAGSADGRLDISDDRKMLSLTSVHIPETPERFSCLQVLSSQRFFSGRHYWEVDVGGSEWWGIGMCYPSIDRKGGNSGIGYNNKSWGMYREIKKEFIMRHDRKVIPLGSRLPSDRIRVYLDYEAGQLSFYALCDPVRHLHTYNVRFTEPLHALLGVWIGSIKISGGK